MLRALRHGLFGLLLLLAQAGAMAHAYGHALDADIDAPHVCEQCLAFAPMGAGAAGTALIPRVPAQGVFFDAPRPTAIFAHFQACYRSRAPPR